MRLGMILAMFLIGGPGSALAATEYWVSQDPTTKTCHIDEKMPDGKTRVMIGATSYPTEEAAKAAKKVAITAGQCVKKKPD